MNDKSIESLNLGMFKAYDIRTPAEYLTLELSERLAHAEACYFREQLGTDKVVLARDARLTGPRYLEQGIKIFRDLGFTVYVAPQVSSTCLFYYSCMRHPDAAGIIYGASHNPGGDTGQKIVGPGLQPIADGCGANGGLVEIRKLYERGARLKPMIPGGLEAISYLEDFVEYSLALADFKSGALKGARILQDFLCGAAAPEFILAFRQAGADLEAINLVPDGNFPRGAPNPVVGESIAPSLKKLREGNFDFGMFFDGDGDRMDLVSPQGKQLSPAFNFSALAPRLKALFPEWKDPQVYVDLKANPLAISRIAKQGLGVRVIRNGHSQIKEALRRNQKEGHQSLTVMGAVEESAHYYLNFKMGDRIFPSENTLFYGLLSARSWLESPSLYRELLELQDTTFREREWGYRFSEDGLRAEALAAVESKFLAWGGNSMSRTEDGMDMEATLLRQGLPFIVNEQTVITSEWTQIAQRTSQSEKGLARWEVTAGTEKRKAEAVRLIEETVKKFGAGSRYVG